MQIILPRDALHSEALAVVRCPSVCLSFLHSCKIKTAEDIIKRFVGQTHPKLPNFKGNRLCRGVEYTQEKFAIRYSLKLLCITNA